MRSGRQTGLWGLVILGLGLTGCSTTSASPTPSPPTPAPEAAQVVETGTNTAPTDPDELPFNNCGTTVPFTGKHTVTRELTYTTSWEFGSQLGIGGEIAVSPLVKVNIDATLSAKYGKTVGQTTTFSDTFDINVPKDSRMTYIFNWKESQRLGHVLAGGQQVNFKYPLTLQFAGAQTSQDDCNPPKVTVTVAVPPPTPAPPAGLTAALPVKPLPIMISKTPVPVKPSPTGVPASKLVKNWVNVDPTTEGITSMMITPSGGSLSVETFGKCTPTDCDWGVVQVPYAGTGPLTVPYKFSFKTTTLSASLEADRLNVTEADHYTDSSGRPDRQVKYQLH